MDNFAVLEHYNIPSDILMKMLEIYQLMGKNINLEEILKDDKVYHHQNTLNLDTYFIVKMVTGNAISDNRLFQLIEKKATPKNQQEEVVKNAKKVLMELEQNASLSRPYNGSDLLDALNGIVGRRKVSFSKDLITNNLNKKEKMSVRLYYQQILDKYQRYFHEQKFERIFLAVICYMEIINLNPYTCYNDLASKLAFYYMMHLSGLTVFKYVSLFSLLNEIEADLANTIAYSSLNYYESYLQTAPVVRLIYKLIIDAYSKLDKIKKEATYHNRIFKSDVIEDTIRKLPDVFTKDDIRRAHPTTSDATINRILFKLRDEEYIIPLGKGRSAMWHKNPSYDKRKLLIKDFKEEDDDDDRD